MASGQARVLQETNPAPVIMFDRRGLPRWHPIWEGNPRIVRHAREGKAQQIVNGPGVRPYIAEKTPRRWTWRDWGGPPRGEIYFSETESDFGLLNAGRIVLEPHTKDKASPNKDWGWTRWSKLSWLLQRQGVRVTQVGPAGTRLLEAADFVETRDFRLAAAVLARARAAVVPEGGLHHAAAALGVPALVIFGGFIAPAVTGYAGQVSFYEGDGLGCGMRVPCEHCRDAMAKIEPEAVAARFMEILKQ